MIAVVIAIALNLLFIGPHGHAGLALATAIAAWCNVFMLYAGLSRRDHYQAGKELFLRIFRIAVAAAIMGAAIGWLSGWLGNGFSGDALSQIRSVAILVGSGGFVYLVAALAVGAIKLSELRQISKRAS